MDTGSNEGFSAQPSGSEPNPAPVRQKAKYQTPKLAQYGHVAKLTQGGTGTVGDGQGMSMQPCL
ncbi:MAG TPA: lasso RiPP family leader peptide-containing protein [Bryobacteraceae bacterium]|nr:lasso RiPP family leader peptide-containing protein [Bryobacteraceae bacterium]